MIFKQTLSLALVAVFSLPAFASPYIGTGQYFVEPDGWNVGDLNSTSQAWDQLFLLSGNTPDAAYNTNPAIATSSTLGAQAPGFVTGSGNFYSFSANYDMNSEIYNHGTGGTNGTHVIVQTVASTNDLVSVVGGTLEIVDLGGIAIAGGANGGALVAADLVASGPVSSGHGVVNLDVLIWEFYLPSYTGDFRVQWSESLHSSFDQLRIDTMIAPAAFATTQFSYTQIPEPASLVLGLLGLTGIVACRRNRRA